MAVSRRSIFTKLTSVLWEECYNILDGALTERLRGGLQNLLNGFDSHTCLHFRARMVELVDTRDLKSLGHYGRAGSSPALRTKENSRHNLRAVFFCVQFIDVTC
jgi:hypothetical protein